MKILAIDPGPAKSAWVVYEGGDVFEFGITENKELREMLTNISGFDDYFKGTEHLFIEMIANMGMAVGQSVFETVLWSGRFVECYAGPWSLVYRKDVKMHLCGSMKAKDANIRQAVMDRYGSIREVAIGTKKKPGPLYGVSKDVWSALAIAITGSET